MVTQARGEIALEEDRQAIALNTSNSTEGKDMSPGVVTTGDKQPWHNLTREEPTSNKDVMEHPMKFLDQASGQLLERQDEPKSMKFN